jgi:SRSO17 transposase
VLHLVGQCQVVRQADATKVREPVMPRRGAIEPWMIDDTSFAKKGRQPVGVHHHDAGC